MKKTSKLKSEWKREEPMFLDKKDKRYKKHMSQLKKQGFSDSETWGLSVTIAEFTIPRLIRFREIEFDHPANLKSRKEWNKILDKMIKYLTAVAEEDTDYTANQKNYDEFFTLFKEYFLDLWW